MLRVKLFHFTAWPDHGVPDYATPILGFHRRVQSQHKPSKGPILIHCSAGVGRTGTYIAIDNVLDQISVEGLIDISGTIVKSRNQRMKLVQTQVGIHHSNAIASIIAAILILLSMLNAPFPVGPICVHPRCYPGVSDVWRHSDQCWRSAQTDTEDVISSLGKNHLRFPIPVPNSGTGYSKS